MKTVVPKHEPLKRLPVLRAVGVSLVLWSLITAAILALAGCQTTEQTLDTQQEAATAVAAKRGQFETSCAEASASVLSRNLVRAPQDQRQMTSVPNVTQYTVGVSGCGQRSVYTVLCQVGSSSCTVVEARQTSTPPAPGPAKSSASDLPPGFPPPPPNAPLPK